MKTCKCCVGNATFDAAQDVNRIRSNVRKFQSEMFTVWRCRSCGSLHSLEEIELDRYYEGYFIHRQRVDFFARRLFSSRLRLLKSVGLSSQHSILDYGCGNGGFVRFLSAQGYERVDGYDPYAEEFANQSVLKSKYDWILAQDVIEHVVEPLGLLDQFASLVRRPGGMLVIGTPNAEGLDLHDPIDAVGQLHQPFHRHIFSGSELTRQLQVRHFEIERAQYRSYVDTWIPFVNSTFLFNYMAAIDGTVDSGFDPIRFGLILRSPRLLIFGLFGRLLGPGKDISLVCSAC